MPNVMIAAAIDKEIRARKRGEFIRGNLGIAFVPTCRDLALANPLDDR